MYPAESVAVGNISNELFVPPEVFPSTVVHLPLGYAVSLLDVVVRVAKGSWDRVSRSSNPMNQFGGVVVGEVIRRCELRGRSWKSRAPHKGITAGTPCERVNSLRSENPKELP
jgi:hypothetical protein